MARVELLTKERAPLLARPYYDAGDPGPIAAALAHVPELLETALPFIDSVLGPTSLDERVKEIVILRISSANRCHYCTETHTAVARRLRFSPSDLTALRGEGPVPDGWPPREDAVYRFSEAIADQPSAAVPILGEHFSESEIVELVTLAAATVMLNRFATALDLPV